MTRLMPKILGTSFTMLLLNFGCQTVKKDTDKSSQTKSQPRDLAEDILEQNTKPYYVVFLTSDNNGNQQCLELDGGQIKINQCTFGNQDDGTKEISGARPTQVWGHVNQTPYIPMASITLASAANSINFYLNEDLDSSSSTGLHMGSNFDWVTFGGDASSQTILVNNKCIRRTSNSDANQMAQLASGDCIEFKMYVAKDYNEMGRDVIISALGDMPVSPKVPYKQLCGAFMKNGDWIPQNNSCIIFDTQYSRWDLKEPNHAMAKVQINWPYGYDAYSTFTFGSEKKIANLEPIKINDKIYFMIVTSKAVTDSQPGAYVHYKKSCVGINEGPKSDGTTNRVDWTHAEDNELRCLAFSILDENGNDTTQSYFHTVYANQAQCNSLGFETCMQPLVDNTFSRFDYFSGRMRTCDKDGFIKYCTICMDGKVFDKHRMDLANRRESSTLQSFVKDYYNKSWGPAVGDIPTIEYKNENQFEKPKGRQYHDYSLDCVIRKPI